MHMVSAWASSNRLSPGQVATAERSNEITAIPQPLGLLELKGCIVTIDAVGCRSVLAQRIVAQGADYVFAVKDNQPELYTAIQDYIRDRPWGNFAHVPAATRDETDAEYGCCEVRRCWVVQDPDTLPEA